jgi:hypothetical protein
MGFPHPANAARKPAQTRMPATPEGMRAKRSRKMKRFVALMALTTIMMLTIISTGRPAFADETKFIGVITKIDIAGKDAKTATVVLKDNKTEQPITVVVNDDLTLDKFKDHRIVEGDEIRCKYETKDGKNLSTYFRKTAGC